MEDIKQLLFSMTKQEMDNIRTKYKAKIPDPLNRQFPERTSKDMAIRRHKARNELRTELFPSGKAITKISVKVKNPVPPTRWPTHRPTRWPTHHQHTTDTSADTLQYFPFVTIILLFLSVGSKNNFIRKDENVIAKQSPFLK